MQGFSRCNNIEPTQQHHQPMCAQTALKTATHKSDNLTTVVAAVNDDYPRSHPLSSLTDRAEERMLSLASVIN